MTLAPVASSLALASLVVGLAGSSVSQSDRVRGAGVVRLRAQAPRAVYLRALELDLGSTESEVLSALLRCQREPLPDRCDEATFANEAPTHRQRIAAFWLARTEVTVAEYERCVVAGRCRSPSVEDGAARFQRLDYPVTQVSFEDASRYCAWRSGRLPTEAEFERAARGASRRAFPWGNSFNGRLANHGRLGIDVTDSSDGFVELAPVGSFPDGATPEGILDLAGNVEEWTTDPFSPSYGSPATAERVVRGGHFASAAPWLRAAARAGRAPDTRQPTLGFRCAWPVEPTRE